MFVMANPTGTLWLAECSTCGPLGVVRATEVDAFLLIHFNTHKETHALHA